MTKEAKQLLSDEIRAALREHLTGATRYSVCKATGLRSSQITRFLHKGGGLEMANLDKLAAHLNLHIEGPLDKPQEPA